MIGDEGVQLDAFAVDVRELLSTTVADLYSHLITRPTGRAVRMAIESQLGELRGPTLSLVDFSSVSILDFSCADEVVAKLLLGLRDGHPVQGDCFVVFRGLRPYHREPVTAVLERHRIHAVVDPGDGPAELLGPIAPERKRLWNRVERTGRVAGERVEELLREGRFDASDLSHLLRARSLFRHPFRGDLYSLAHLARALASTVPRSSDLPDLAAPNPDD